MTVTAASLQALREGNPPVEQILLAQVTELRTAKTQAGNPFFDMALTDVTGTIRIKIWQKTEAFQFLEGANQGDFVRLSGRFSRNNFGLNIEEPQLERLSEEEKRAVLVGSEERVADLQRDWDEILEAVELMAERRLWKLCKLALVKYENGWKRAAAARSYHHARRGGLLEHTAQMMRVANAVAPLYPEVHFDLLSAGVIFHDIGKLWENDYPEGGFVSPPSFLGELVGHVSIGVEVLNKLWRQAEGEEPELFAEKEPPSELLRQHLIHLIVSHHGQREFGAPVTPRTPEAHLLHYIDNLDAKLEMVRMALRAGQEVAEGLYEAKRPLEGWVAKPLRWSMPKV